MCKQAEKRTEGSIAFALEGPSPKRGDDDAEEEGKRETCETTREKKRKRNKAKHLDKNFSEFFSNLDSEIDFALEPIIRASSNCSAEILAATG